MNGWPAPQMDYLEIDCFRRVSCERCGRKHRKRVMIATYWVLHGDRLDVSPVTSRIAGSYRVTLRSRPRGRIIERAVSTEKPRSP